MFLNVLPQLLWLAPFSAFLIRIALAIIFVLAGYAHAWVRSGARAHILGWIELATAIALALGLFSQIASLAAFLLALVWLFGKEYRLYAKSTVLLVLVLSLSLLLTGAGPFAFDLPL